MSKRGLLIGLTLLVMAMPGWAQPTYNFDLEPVTPGIQTASQVAVNDVFLVNVVMTNALDLLGYSFDFDFPEGLLELIAVYENPGDLNFDSIVALDELAATINFFIANLTRDPRWPLTSDEGDPEQFLFEGARAGVVLDMNADNDLGLDELSLVINEYILDLQGSGQTYWTDIAYGRDNGGPNESVEIADPPGLSNAGMPGAGRVNDITAVLLARPDRVVGNVRPDFGVDGDLVLVTLKFKALAVGSAVLSFVHEGDEHPVYIDENFQNIETDVIDVLEANTPSSTITIVAP